MLFFSFPRAQQNSNPVHSTSGLGYRSLEIRSFISTDASFRPIQL